MKSLGQTLFELSRYKESVDRQTDGRTDRQTDGRTDKVITIGLPHLRWRGPNNFFALFLIFVEVKDLSGSIFLLKASPH